MPPTDTHTLCSGGEQTAGNTDRDSSQTDSRFGSGGRWSGTPDGAVLSPLNTHEFPLW